MNIFVLDESPLIAAWYLCDQHVVKMLLESTQLLCLPFDDAPYKKTHTSHPCAKWVLADQANWEWLYAHALELVYEYTIRYGKVHKCTRILLDLPRKGCTQKPLSFVQCMPDEFKVEGDPVAAYRKYYQHKYDEWQKHERKQYRMRYKDGKWPKWLVREKE